jgi:hypothetical protein
MYRFGSPSRLDPPRRMRRRAGDDARRRGGMRALHDLGASVPALSSRVGSHAGGVLINHFNYRTEPCARPGAATAMGKEYREDHP